MLNFWSSTCAPCVIEHPQLAELAQLGIPLYSIDYKDKPEGARRFLTSHGNPYRAIGADESGMTAIDFGVTGTPETFVINRQGRVVFRYQGPITPEVLSAKIMPGHPQSGAGNRRAALLTPAQRPPHSVSLPKGRDL